MDPSLSELLLPGLKLMLVGMGIVFLFLSLLVWVIGATARLVKSSDQAQPVAQRVPAGAEADEAERVAVIAAALRLSRGLRRH